MMQPVAARYDVYCARCGYGAVVQAPPSFCPMCHESAWTDPAWSRSPWREVPYGSGQVDVLEPVAAGVGVGNRV